MSWTVFGQEYIQITREQQRQCIKWHSENQYKDSIIIQKDSVINFMGDVIYIERAQNKAISDTLTAVRLDNLVQQKKVKRNRRIAIGGFSGFLGAIILLFGIK